MLKTYRYVPAPLIKEPVENMGFGEFAGYLAKARYLEEVECDIHIRALKKLFED